MKSIEQMADELVAFSALPEVVGGKWVIVAGVGIGVMEAIRRPMIVSAVAAVLREARRQQDAFATGEAPCTRDEVDEAMKTMHLSSSKSVVEKYIAHLEAQVAWLARDTGHAESYQAGWKAGHRAGFQDGGNAVRDHEYDNQNM